MKASTIQRTSLEELNKVNVVGTSGSGKSTFSKKLAEAIHAPYIELDKVFWEPNWKMPSDEVFFERLQKALPQDRWVLDGNYTRTIPIKWKEVDLVIWIDLPFYRTFYQAIKRAIQRTLSQQELWEGTGNRESFRRSFLSKDSILLWTIISYGRVKEKYEAMMSDPKYAHIHFLRLRSSKEIKQFLDTVRRSQKQENQL